MIKPTASERKIRPTIQAPAAAILGPRFFGDPLEGVEDDVVDADSGADLEDVVVKSADEEVIAAVDGIRAPLALKNVSETDVL